MCHLCVGITGGAGSPPNMPYRQSGAVSGDSISYSHVIEFCKPSAGVWFNENDEPPRYSCGDFTRNLDVYPLNDATLYDGMTGNYKFGNSEMVLVYVRLENYPRSGGYIKLDFKNPAGFTFFSTQTSLPLPDPNWTWWYAWVWGVVGKFDSTSGYSADEIITPGNYRTVVSTPWGGANVDYVVTGTPPPVYMPLTFEVVGPGTFFVMKNDQLVATALPGIPKTVEYKIGDIIGFNAYPDAGASLVSVCDYPQTECKAEQIGRYDVIGQLPQKMIATFQPGCVSTLWACEVPANGYEVNGCGDRRLAARCNPVSNVLTLSVDKSKVVIGDPVIFSVTGAPPGTDIELFEKGYIGLDNKLLGTNKSGIFTVTPGGNHNYFARYKDLFTTFINSNEVYVEVTDQFGNPIGGDSLSQLLGYVPYAIGAYVLVNLFGGRR